MIFQGVSSIDGKGPSSRATKKGNAQLNGMKKVTVPSIAYIAVLVCLLNYANELLLISTLGPPCLILSANIRSWWLSW